MMNHSEWKCWAVCLLAVSLGSLWANGFRNPPEGPNALARSGGRTAYIDDASAITHNPANLVFLDADEFLVALTLGYTNHTATRNGSSSSTEDDIKALPNLWLAMRLPEQDAVIGLGVTTPYGQSTSWSKEGVFRYSAPYFSELRLVNINPTYAVKVAPRVSLGVGLDIYASDLTFKQLTPPPFAGNLEFYGRGQGVGGNVALTWEFTDNQRFAVTYQSPVNVQYEGEMKVSNPPPGFVPETDAETSLHFPARVVAAYGFRPVPALAVGIDIEWVEFSRYDELDLDVDPPNQALGQDLNQEWEDIWTAGIGFDWAVNDAWNLRGGYNYLPTPIPDETHSPVIPDADRHVMTAGFAYRYGAHTVSLAYAYTLFEDREVDNNQQPLFNADYELNAHLVSIAYGYRF